MSIQRRAGGMAVFGVAVFLAAGGVTHAEERLCDPSFENCRTRLLALIDSERAGIDVAFWFMEDSRYVTRLINRWKAGVPIRIIVDPRANEDYPLNRTSLQQLEQAGIPMRRKSGGGIMHWKMMIFAGQNMVEFGSANYSDNAFVPVSDYVNYVSETIYYSDDPAVVTSFKTRFDDRWTSTGSYTNYANVTSPTRRYSTYPIVSDLNFPPAQNYSNRAVRLYDAETRGIDAVMYRVTDRRHSDALIAAWERGVPVRYIGEMSEYRNPERPWVSWNMDRMHAAGIPMRVRAHAGMNHQKLVLLYDQRLSIFGSSNWTSASASAQEEHNYFTTKGWMFEWFAKQFERRWNSTNPIGAVETKAFVPLPPDRPSYASPGDGEIDVAAEGLLLVWKGGPWAHVYDVYFGTTPDPPLLAPDLELGPSESGADRQRYLLPRLMPGTTYYWKIVSKTAAGLAATGHVSSFTTLF